MPVVRTGKAEATETEAPDKEASVVLEDVRGSCGDREAKVEEAKGGSLDHIRVARGVACSKKDYTTEVAKGVTRDGRDNEGEGHVSSSTADCVAATSAAAPWHKELAQQRRKQTSAVEPPANPRLH